MTAAILLRENGLYKGFVMSGHSGHGSVGNDIVCAALSSAAYLAANILSLDEENAKISIEEGKLRVFVKAPDELSQSVFTALGFQLADIRRQYPENFRLCKLTLTGGKNNV